MLPLHSSFSFRVESSNLGVHPRPEWTGHDMVRSERWATVIIRRDIFYGVFYVCGLNLSKAVLLESDNVHLCFSAEFQIEFQSTILENLEGSGGH